MDLAICRHLKLDGRRCGSPALRGQHYCYFHAPAHRAIPSVNLWPKLKVRTPSASPSQTQRRISHVAHPYDPCQNCRLTGDALAIQVGLSGVVQGLTQGVLSVRQAKLLLKALHRAMANLGDGTATGDSPVTSNEVQLPISDGCGAVTSESQRG